MIAGTDAASADADADAAAAADSASAQAAAELASANAFKAALTSIQAAVATDNQTYLAEEAMSTGDNIAESDEQNKVNAATQAVTVLLGIDAIAEIVEHGVELLAAWSTLAAAVVSQVPVVGIEAATVAADLGINAAVTGFFVATLDAAVSIATDAQYYDTLQLEN